MNKRELGTKYEEKSVEILKDNGYEILEQNYSIRKAEIDIIAKKDNVIVFVEVKYRSTNYFGYGAEAVDAKKIAKICSAAKAYLSSKKIKNCDIRIDCMSFLADELTWIKNITWGDSNEF